MDSESSFNLEEISKYRGSHDREIVERQTRTLKEALRKGRSQANSTDFRGTRPGHRTDWLHTLPWMEDQNLCGRQAKLVNFSSLWLPISLASVHA